MRRAAWWQLFAAVSAAIDSGSTASLPEMRRAAEIAYALATRHGTQTARGR